MKSHTIPSRLYFRRSRYRKVVVAGLSAAWIAGIAALILTAAPASAL